MQVPALPLSLSGAASTGNTEKQPHYLHFTLWPALSIALGLELGLELELGLVSLIVLMTRGSVRKLPSQGKRVNCSL